MFEVSFFGVDLGKGTNIHSIYIRILKYRKGWYQVEYEASNSGFYVAIKNLNLYIKDSLKG